MRVASALELPPEFLDALVVARNAERGRALRDLERLLELLVLRQEGDEPLDERKAQLHRRALLVARGGLADDLARGGDLRLARLVAMALRVRELMAPR